MPAQAEERRLRRGLPRVPGGEPWPPASDVAPVVERAQEPVVERAQRVETSSPGLSLRRGLPRTPGGEAWPPAGVVAGTPAVDQGASSPAAAPPALNDQEQEPLGAPVVDRAQPPVVERAQRVETHSSAASLRRGLPRTPGGEPWPPADTVVAGASAAATATAPTPVAEKELQPAASVPPAAKIDVSEPLPFQRTVFPGRYAGTRPAPKPEPKRVGPFTRGQWAGAVLVGGAGLLIAAAIAVSFVRWLLSTPPLQDFLQTYPGEYHLPEGAPVGFPGWLAWQHFFNFFLMVLIIRSGLRVRTEKRPSVFWTARNNRKSKISLTLWFHQALDILWLVNGVVFVVLLLVTGQWMRVVPTSWEVFPNALSAALQYVSLEWPTENGWVNYNSLQQLAYFATIFLAAPLATITGYRMSGLWPKNAEKLNRAYPVEWARALHFPVMLYFVVFIFIHVALVLATGALRNLNHMYAAQGSVDGVEYATNWTGFWLFVASLVVVAAAWVAARPLTIAPIAKLFGNVSGR